MAITTTALAPLGLVRAAPPANDSYAAPQQISGESGVLTASTIEATTDVCFAVKDFRLRNSIWYRWRAPSSGFLRLSTVGSSFAAEIHVHFAGEACPNGGWAGSDGSHLPTTDFQVKVRQGVDYVIGVGGEDRGTAALGWRFLKPPPMPEDSFAHARRLYGIHGFIGATNAQATREVGEPRHAGEPGGASLWYAWTAPESGPAIFNTSASEQDRDTVLAVYRGTSLGSLVSVGADDDSGAGTSARVAFQAVAGTTYRIAIDTAGGLQSAASGPGGPHWRGLFLTWTSGTPHDHDSLVDAHLLPGPHGVLYGETVRASLEPGEPFHWDDPFDEVDEWGGASVWYRFDAGWDGFASASVRRLVNESRPRIAVYRGSSVANLEVLAKNDHSDFDSVSVGWPVTRGESYFIAVDALHEHVGPFALSWSTTAPNDDFADASELDGNAGITWASQSAMTAEPGEPMHGGFAAKRSVWFEWTPTVSDPKAEIHLGIEGMRLGVYTGERLESLVAVPTVLITHSMWQFPVSAGGTYRIALDSGGIVPLTSDVRWVAGPRDTTPPTATLTSPAGDTVISGAFGMAAEADDASGIAQVEFMVGSDQGGFNPQTAMRDDETPFDGSSAGHDGVLQMMARATDRYGNTTMSVPVEGLFDTLPAGTSVPEFAPAGEGNVTATWRPAYDVAQTVCAVDTGPFAPCTSPTSLTGLTNGLHWFLIRAVDTAGRSQPAAGLVLFRVGPTPQPPLPSTGNPPPTPAPTAAPTPSATPIPPAPTPAPASGVTRQAGANRYATAAAVSKATYPGGNVPVAFVASGLNFPDALAGAAAAGRLGGPLLLVATSSIPSPTASELQRLDPGRIVVLGGTGVVSSGVASQLDAFTAGPVTRQAGANRYATAAAVSRATYPGGNVPVAFVASGLNFPDALAGAAAAGRLGGPLLLVATSSIPSPTAAELQRLDPGRIVVLGGTGVVSSGVASQLENFLR